MILLLVVLFFLGAEEAGKEEVFLLAEDGLVMIGSRVACLDISWAKVGD